MSASEPAGGATRRDALKVFLAGGALVVALPGAAFAARGDASAAAVGPFIEIRPDNRVRIAAPVPDMGTGIETALPMIVAEELDADWREVEVFRLPAAVHVAEDGEVAEKYLSQTTGGSGAVRRSWTPLRDAAALARMLILAAAARELGVAPGGLSTERSHVVVAATGARHPYARFAEAAAALAGDAAPLRRIEEGGEVFFRPDIPPQSEGGPRRKRRDEFALIGTPQRQKRLREIVTGREEFGIDLDLPGQSVALIARCPHFDGSVAAYDADAARAVNGVLHVIEVPRLTDGDGARPLNPAGVAVVATSFWAAKKGRDALNVRWDQGPHTHESDAFHRAAQKDALADRDRERQIIYESGDVEAGLARAETTLAAAYTVPHFAHFTMEPLNCAAHVTAERCVLATSHQNPAHAAQFAARMTGLPVDAIEVRSGRLGCGLGRKYLQDPVAEAIYLSQAVKGPVKVYWTREDDTTNDRLNPAGRFEFRAGLDAGGRLTAWHAAFASHAGTRMGGFPAQLFDDQRVERIRTEGATPIGAWRGPGHNVSGFATEGFLNEVAAAAGADPLQFRLDLLGEDRDLPMLEWAPLKKDAGISTRKMKGVLRLAAARADWGAALPESWGRGIASYMTFGGYVAMVVDVSLDARRRLTVERVFAGVDCGLVVNPAGARAQIESGINDGLSTALYQNVVIDGGRIMTENFDDIRLMRIGEAPREIDVAFVDSDEHPWGTGEMALPVFIPALMAAIHDATGVRVRDLPIGDQLRA